MVTAAQRKSQRTIQRYAKRRRERDQPRYVSPPKETVVKVEAKPGVEPKVVTDVQQAEQLIKAGVITREEAAKVTPGVARQPSGVEATRIIKERREPIVEQPTQVQPTGGQVQVGLTPVGPRAPPQIISPERKLIKKAFEGTGTFLRTRVQPLFYRPEEAKGPTVIKPAAEVTAKYILEPSLKYYAEEKRISPETALTGAAIIKEFKARPEKYIGEAILMTTATPIFAKGGQLLVKGAIRTGLYKLGTKAPSITKKISRAALRAGLPAAYGIGAGFEYATAPTEEARREVFAKKVLEGPALYAGLKLGESLPITKRIVGETEFIKTAFLLPKQEKEYAETLFKFGKGFPEMETLAPGRIPFEQIKPEGAARPIPKKLAKELREWSVAHKEDLLLGGSLTLPTYGIKGIDVRDVDYFAKMGGKFKPAESLGTFLTKKGFKPITKAEKVFVGELKVEFHPFEAGEHFGWKQFPFVEAPKLSPEGIPVITLKEQTKRLAFGVAMGRRGGKDIPRGKEIVLKFARLREEVAGESILFRGMRVKQAKQFRREIEMVFPKGEKLIPSHELLPQKVRIKSPKGRRKVVERELSIKERPLTLERELKGLKRPTTYKPYKPTVYKPYTPSPYRPYKPYQPYKPTPYKPYQPYEPSPYRPYEPTTYKPYKPYAPYSGAPYRPYEPYKGRPYRPYVPYRYRPITSKTTRGFLLLPPKRGREKPSKVKHFVAPRPFSYVPSITAFEFNIVGKPLEFGKRGFLTGLAIRPLAKSVELPKFDTRGY